MNQKYGKGLEIKTFLWWLVIWLLKGFKALCENFPHKNFNSMPLIKTVLLLMCNFPLFIQRFFQIKEFNKLSVYLC